jgi:hypothetical protein
MESTYDSDFYAWANTQAALLRSGRIDQADIEHIAEEIESMGKSELRELENRLARLFTHLLKWQFQPNRRSRSWTLTIKEQRRRLHRHLAQNPSLKATLEQAVLDAYGDAILEAAGPVPELFIVGGATLYAEALPRADGLYLTLVHAAVEGDARFPQWDPADWVEVSRVERPADARNAYAMTFLELRRVPRLRA